MIVDLQPKWEAGEDPGFITEQVASIEENARGGWTVRFKSTTKVHHYRRQRLLVLSRPKTIELGRKGLYINKKRIHDATEILRFTDGLHTFYHVTFRNGLSKCYHGRSVYITRTPLDQLGDSTWDYLWKLAEETGLLISDEENILINQYALVDVKRDNVPLAQYLGSPHKLATYPLPKHVYYPFGCNESQKAAVEAALTHQVSLVQGPPGTGKTQTILNIIANLLLADKTILVVSSNNSAVQNIAEKLEEEGLGFITATLGSVQNKQAFLEQQMSDYPDMTHWRVAEPDRLKRSVTQKLQTVTQGFADQTKVVKLRAELSALKTEETHHHLRHNEISVQPLDWLQGQSSSQLMQLLGQCIRRIERGEQSNLWFRLKWSLRLGRQIFAFLRQDLEHVIACLERTYYQMRRAEIERELEQTTSRLESLHLREGISELRSASLQTLKAHIVERYSRDDKRPHFPTSSSIKLRSEEFLREYPIVLSTTYLAKGCINKDLVFDYVIMDEASQIDIKTGALALSCAVNTVIVGDDMQLPSVVTEQDKLALDAISQVYTIDERYNPITHSFLRSSFEVFTHAPTTLLREHYRCHPKIIEFCNQKFYHGALVPMTDDCGEEKVLQILRTVPGNHARGRYNQREIDVIIQEVLPQFAGHKSVGIITPYRDQAEAINKILRKDIASTVHKYQGRECDIIILSMVSNTTSEFSDSKHLLNVAISRAKSHLCIVATGNDLSENSHLAQLIAYAQYSNFEVKTSRLHSVFDLLYKQYTDERLTYLRQQKQNQPAELSELLIYDALSQACAKLGRSDLAIASRYPLYRLLADCSVLDEEERAFVAHPWSHVDLLVYSALTKRPMLIIEVDGWQYHQAHSAQETRDVLKDKILTKYALKPYRIRTTDTVTVESLCSVLKTCLEA